MALRTKTKIYSGKRKTAVAKVKAVDGSGKIFFNKLPHAELSLFHKLALIEPIRIHERELGPVKHDFHIKTVSGGKESQIQAARLAIARALLDLSGSEVLKKEFVKYDRNMIIPDSRRKEAYKPGDSKARSRRQKSYR